MFIYYSNYDEFKSETEFYALLAKEVNNGN